MDAGVGGQLQGISLDSFLQMVQMEKTTCTLNVVSGNKKGTLYVLNGELISAKTGGLQNLEAACSIISWDDAVIDIENTCVKTENEINQPLMHVLMEGLKLKDEKTAERQENNLEATVPSDTAPAASAEGEEAPPSGRDVSRQGESFELHVAPQKKGRLPAILIIAGIVLVAAVAAYFTLFNSPSNSIEQIYQDTLVKVELTDNPDKQVALLQNFINSSDVENEWSKAASLKLAEYKTMHANAAFIETSSRAAKLVGTRAYLKAIDLYLDFLKRFPTSPDTAQVKTEIARLKDLAEKTEYEAATAATKSGDINRMDAYRAFVKNHPDSKRVADIKKLITEMESAYFAYTEKQIAKSALAEDWENCTRLVAGYAAIYPEGSNTQKLQKFLPLFKKNRLEYADYETAMAKAQDAGTDYSKARTILSDYLRAFPRSHLTKKIEAQIARYKKMDEEAKLTRRIASVETLLLKSENRFVSNGDGTFTDTRTGLMWCTLDSRSVLDSCLDYESAIAYIKALKTGGHGNWRLPSPAELKDLYKDKPFFPATQSAWLWTSKILKKYVGEWLIDVTVVTADKTPIQTESVKDSRNCGNVRAVRTASR